MAKKKTRWWRGRELKRLKRQRAHALNKANKLFTEMMFMDNSSEKLDKRTTLYELREQAARLGDTIDRLKLEELNQFHQRIQNETRSGDEGR